MGKANKIAIIFGFLVFTNFVITDAYASHAGHFAEFLISQSITIIFITVIGGSIALAIIAKKFIHKPMKSDKAFEEKLFKMKTRKGIIYIIIGVIIPTPAFIWVKSYIDSVGSYACGNPSFTSDCDFFLILWGITGLIGLIVIIKGLVTIAKRKKLTKIEDVQKKDIDKDKKIKELEKRLDKIDEEKIKSEDNPENS